MSNSKSHELAIKYLDPKLYGVETRDAGTHYEYRFSIPESSVDSFNKSMESFISYIHGDRNINDPDIIEACEREGIDPNVLVSRIETRLPTDKKGPWKDQQGLTGEMLLFLQFASTHPSADTNARNVFRDVSNISIAGIDVYAFDFDTSEKPRACAWLGESKAANTGSSLTSQMNSLDKRYSSEISLSVFRTLINSNIANYEMQGEMDKAKAIRLLIVDFVKRDANCRINCAPFIVYNAALDIEKQLKRIPKWKTVSVWPKDSIHMHSLPVEEWGDKVKEWWKNYVT